jgi:hypothetical protein
MSIHLHSVILTLERSEGEESASRIFFYLSSRSEAKGSAFLSMQSSETNAAYSPPSAGPSVSAGVSGLAAAEVLGLPTK